MFYSKVNLLKTLGSYLFSCLLAVSHSQAEPAENKASDGQPADNQIPGYQVALYDVPHYQIVRVNPQSIQLDGLLDDPAWQSAQVIQQQFHYPWRQEQAPITRFQAVWDKQYLYFSFAVEDSDIVVLEEITTELDIGNEDRVEVFFAPSALEQPIASEGSCALPTYIGVEIDAKGRVLDFTARYYRRFDFTWDMPGLKVAAKSTQSGYQLEARVPLATLYDLKLIDQQQRLLAGVFRGEFSGSGDQLTSRWISWVNPQTPQPDFHITSAFGYLQLLD